MKLCLISDLWSARHSGISVGEHTETRSAVSADVWAGDGRNVVRPPHNKGLHYSVLWEDCQGKSILCVINESCSSNRWQKCCMPFLP